MPQIKHREKRLGVTIVMLAVVLVLVIAGAVYLALVKNQQAVGAQSTWKQAEQLDQNQLYNNEYVLLSNYINSNPPKQYRYRVLVQLGLLASNQKKYQDSLKWYQQAKSVRKGEDEIPLDIGLASAEANLGDKQAAIADYKQAIKQIESSPDYQLDPDTGIDNYKESIRRLGGTP
jgi:tetratricopeptide (TPR) repeat protein